MVTVRRGNGSIGAIDVPADKLWGVQAQRSPERFRISTEKMSVSLIRALALTKRVATKVNQDLGLLTEDRARTIIQAVNEVLADKHYDEFLLAIWQIGSDTQSSMNVSEVLVNQASELLDSVREMERRVHPNDDVGKSQSSNDIFPIAMHIAALLALRKSLTPQLNVLTKVLSDKFYAFTNIVKIGRTHLQDATPLTLGQEISGWITMLEHSLRHTESSLSRVAELASRGTAVDTGLSTHPEHARRVTDGLRVITCAPFVTAPNKPEALATCDTLIHAHGALKGLAAPLIKITNDVRQLVSSPRCGIGEISTPENEPGNSIMPGKVNPTQCEALTMSCCQVMSSDVAVNMGGVSGNFELSVYRPMVIHNSLRSICLLVDGMESSNGHCAMGTKPNHGRIDRLPNESLILMTALNIHIGYDKAAEITKKAHKEGLMLKASTLALGYLTKVEFDSWVHPELMIGGMRPSSQSATYRCSRGIINFDGCA